MGRAGQSAFAEHQRRRTADRKALRRNLTITLPVVVITPVVVFVAVHVGVHLSNSWLSHWLSVHAPRRGSPIAKTTPTISGSASDLMGAVLAVVATVSVAGQLWGRTPATEAWRRGAEGEQLLGRRLAELQAGGFRMLHDRRVPRSRANVDHLVIGPTGIYMIDTKNYTGRLSASKGALWHGRHPMNKELATTRWEARRVTQVLGGNPAAPLVTVAPIMCILGARLPTPVMEFDGVLVISGGKRLLQEIRRRPVVLSAESVQALAEVANLALVEA